MHRANRSSTPRQAAPQAFTLIELLVVISIITLLIAILLPALRSARRASLAVQCLSNQRQLGILIHRYTLDHRGYMPPAYTASTPWTGVVMQHAFYVPPHLVATQIKPIFYCPDMAAQGYTGNSAPTANYYTNYVINHTLSLGGVYGPWGPPAKPSRLDGFVQSTKTAALWDTRGLTSGAPNRAVSATYWAHLNAGNANATVGYVHNVGNLANGFRGGAANMLFLDAHAAAIGDPGSGYPDIARTDVNGFFK